MSLEQAIHQRWANDVTLSTFLPAAKLYTGAARGNADLPYVVLTRLRSEPTGRTSSGTELRRVAVRFDVWAANLEQAKAIGSAMRGVFNRQGFALSGGTCLVMQWDGETETAVENGAWHLTVDYVARVAAAVDVS